MKTLKISNGKAFFCKKNGEEKSILEADKNDILLLIEQIYEDENPQFDITDETNIIANPVELIIYQNLYDKFSDFVNDKKPQLKLEIKSLKDEYEKKYPDQTEHSLLKK